MWHNIAETLGGATVEEWKVRIGAQELLDWQTHFKHNLTFRDHLNMCQANICSWVRHGLNGKNETPEDLRLFLMQYDKVRPKDDEEKSEELQNKADMATATMGRIFSSLVKVKEGNEDNG